MCIYIFVYIYIYKYWSILTISYLVNVVFIHCTLLHISTSIHSTEGIAEGEMRKKQEHTAREEWINKVALIQALRRRRLRSRTSVPSLQPRREGLVGEIHWACKERRVKTAGDQQKEMVMHSFKILTADIWEFAVFCICSFLSASLHTLTCCGN